MNKLNTRALQKSWRAWLGSDAPSVGPAWLSLVWTFLFCCFCAVGFTLLGYSSFSEGEDGWSNWAGCWHWYKVNLIVALFIGYSIRGLFALGCRWLGDDGVRKLEGWRRWVYFVGVPNLGVAIGWPLGSAVAGYPTISVRTLQDPNALAASVLVAVIISLVFSMLFGAAARRLQAEKRAAEAQLRLLQGQIEPHFLFNTLANVSSLMDEDVPRAKLMLETFTDYLRASLGSLRRLDATLGAEMDLVGHYLELMKTRMEERMQYKVLCDPNLRNVVLPPFLLQPLVENALHHGLEPKVEGGSIQVSARQEGAEVVLEVLDDGLGPDVTRRRPGAGIALANVRERLQVQYGGAATLTLSPAEPGMRATIRMPYLAGA
jgi:signal transduction histidine kinase